jgi:tripeptide aminopeptidase
LFSNGGLDANWFDKHGVSMVTIGAGQYENHTVNEYVDRAEFANGCRLAVAPAALEG